MYEFSFFRITHSIRYRMTPRLDLLETQRPISRSFENGANRFHFSLLGRFNAPSSALSFAWRTTGGRSRVRRLRTRMSGPWDRGNDRRNLKARGAKYNLTHERRSRRKVRSRRFLKLLFARCHGCDERRTSQVLIRRKPSARLVRERDIRSTWSRCRAERCREDLRLSRLIPCAIS